MTTRVVCISDTHNKHGLMEVPPGDLLIHAGDVSMMGSPEELLGFIQWFADLPHGKKVLIGGNHDFGLEASTDKLIYRQIMKTKGITYLEGEMTYFNDMKIWGGPWQPMFHDWAFNVARGEPLRAKWSQIPEDTDIVVTHGPPAGIQDITNRTGSGVGDEDLRDELVGRVKPALHVFGHIHEAAGWSNVEGICFVNASSLNLQYEYANAPVELDMYKGKVQVIYDPPGES